MSLLLKCSGFEISNYKVPEFKILRDSYSIIRMPFIMDSEDDCDLLSHLLNEKYHQSMSFGDINPIYSGSINRSRESAFDVFKSGKTIKRLSRHYKKNKEAIARLLLPQNIDFNHSWDKMALFDKCIISFEIASICSPFIFFDTAGLDPIGIKKMCDHATKKCNQGYTVVHLLYSTLSDDISNKEYEFIKKVDKSR